MIPFDIQEGAAESRIDDIPVAGDDRLTYVTLATEVHSGVFVDKNQGDTVQVVTSPLGEDYSEEEARPFAHLTSLKNGQKGGRRRWFTILP